MEIEIKKAKGIREIGNYNFIDLLTKKDIMAIAKLIKKPIVYYDYTNEWNDLTFRKYHLFDGNFVYRFVGKVKKNKAL